MSSFEKKWWFQGLTYGIGYVLTRWLLAEAGAATMNVAYWIVLIAGSVALARAMSFVIWFALLMLAPKVVIDSA